GHATFELCLPDSNGRGTRLLSPRHAFDFFSKFGALGSLQPKDFLAKRKIIEKWLCRPPVDNRSAFKRENAIRQCQDQIEVMFNDNDRYLLAQGVEHAEKLENDGRRQSFKRLVQQQQPGFS